MSERAVGVMLPRDLPAEQFRAYAQRADGLGFDELWVVEDCFYRGGIAQAAALSGAVRHPWRWVWANAVGWPGAMAVIVVGATAPSSTWPTSAILVLGAVTGAVAGGLLGVITGWFLPSLDGPGPQSRRCLPGGVDPPVASSGLSALTRRRASWATDASISATGHR